MHVKTKKRHAHGMVKIHGAGDIKEVLINADIINPEKRIVSVCFKGRNSSGIVELSEEEAEDLGKTLAVQSKLLKASKILRNEKSK